MVHQAAPYNQQNVSGRNRRISVIFVTLIIRGPPPRQTLPRCIQGHTVSQSFIVSAARTLDFYFFRGIDEVRTPQPPLGGGVALLPVPARPLARQLSLCPRPCRYACTLSHCLLCVWCFSLRFGLCLVLCLWFARSRTNMRGG